MKRTMNRLMGISLLSLLLIAYASQTAKAQDVEVSFQSFYDNLAPYGQWVYDPEYGNVWVPNEDGDFRPYGTRGHWVMTDYGNTWVSEDPWGWACYHYGRWTYDPYYGWVWIPGYEWAPAWVSWRSSNTYCGWAPLGPGVGLTFSCPESWWIFVGPQYLYQPDCFHHWRGVQYNRTYIYQTTIVNNYYSDNHTRVQYNYGPRREEMERYTHQPVQVYSFSHSRNPGASQISGQRVSMYRPEINRRSSNDARPANVYQVSRNIGAPQQTLGAGNRNATPAFRQEMQQRQSMPGNRQQTNNQFGQPGNRQPGNTNQYNPQPGNRQPDNNRNRNNIEPRQQMNNQQPVNREPMQQPQPPRNNNFREPVNREPMQQPQPPAQPRNPNYQPPVNRDQQREFQAPPRPQINRNNVEPPRQQPQVQPQPQRQPQMQQPQPQRQPQMQQPQPQRQPQMQQPQPQRQPQMQQPQPQRQQQVEPLHAAPGVQEGRRR